MIFFGNYFSKIKLYIDKLVEINILKAYYWIFLGDDWEHEEIFTDDDEAVGNDPEEREDLAPEIPAPPEIKQVCVSCVDAVILCI